MSSPRPLSLNVVSVAVTVRFEPTVTPGCAGEDREPSAWNVLRVAGTVEPLVYLRYGRWSDSGAGSSPEAETTVTPSNATVAEVPDRNDTASASRRVRVAGPIRSVVCGRWTIPARNVTVPPAKLAHRLSPIARTSTSIPTPLSGNGTTRTTDRVLMRAGRCGRRTST